MNERYPNPTMRHLATAAACVLVSAGVVQASETFPEKIVKSALEAGCNRFDRACPWEEGPAVLQPGLSGGELRVATVILRGTKAIDATFTMDRNLPVIGTTIDTAFSAMRGTQGFEISIDGLVAVSPRSTGTAVALTLVGGDPINISSFNINPLQPAIAGKDGTCPEPKSWEVNRGCMDTTLDSGTFDGVPVIGVNSTDIATRVAAVADIYGAEELCVYDAMLIPAMVSTAKKYGIELDLTGPDRFTNVAIILASGSLRLQFQQLGPIQKILVPMYGRVEDPKTISELFGIVEAATDNAVRSPRNVSVDGCASPGLLPADAIENLTGDIAKLTMAGLAPKYFNIESMTYDYGDESLSPPTDEERNLLGIPS